MSDKISISLRIEKDLHRFFKKNSEGNLTKYLTSLMVRGAVVDIEELYTNAIGTTKIEELREQKYQIESLKRQVENLEMKIKNLESFAKVERDRTKRTTKLLSMQKTILIKFFLSSGTPMENLTKLFKHENTNDNETLTIAKDNGQLITLFGRRLGHTPETMKSWLND